MNRTVDINENDSSRPLFVFPLNVPVVLEVTAATVIYSDRFHSKSLFLEGIRWQTEIRSELIRFYAKQGVVTQIVEELGLPSRKLEDLTTADFAPVIGRTMIITYLGMKTIEDRTFKSFFTMFP